MSAALSIVYVVFSFVSCVSVFFISYYLLSHASSWHSDSGGRPLQLWAIRGLSLILAVTLCLF